MYHIITWAVGLCSLLSTLISSGEQKEYWVLVLTGSTAPYKVSRHSCDLSFCHLSELTVKPSDDGVTSRWNITGAAGVDWRVCSGSLSDLSVRSSALQSPVFLQMIYVSSHCVSTACSVNRSVSPSSLWPGNTTYDQPSNRAAGLFNRQTWFRG